MHILVLIGMNKFCKKKIILIQLSIVNTTLTTILSILLLLVIAEREIHRASLVIRIAKLVATNVNRGVRI
jgi:hypothetical protein